MTVPVALLVGLAVLVALLSSVGLLVLDGPLDRLHVLGPLAPAGILVALAVGLDQGLTLETGKAALVAAILLLSGPALAQALGRAEHVREGS